MDCSTPGSSILHYPLVFAQVQFPAVGSFPMNWLFTSGGLILAFTIANVVVFIVSVQKHNWFLCVDFSSCNSNEFVHYFWKFLSCVVLGVFYISCCLLSSFFFFLIALPRPLSTKLNRSGESGHPCLLDLRENTLCLLAVGFSYMAFFMLRWFLPCLLSNSFNKGCWILSDMFYASVVMIMWF